MSTRARAARHPEKGKAIEPTYIYIYVNVYPCISCTEYVRLRVERNRHQWPCPAERHYWISLTCPVPFTFVQFCMVERPSGAERTQVSNSSTIAQVSGLRFQPLFRGPMQLRSGSERGRAANWKSSEAKTGSSGQFERPNRAETGSSGPFELPSEAEAVSCVQFEAPRRGQAGWSGRRRASQRSRGGSSGRLERLSESEAVPSG